MSTSKVGHEAPNQKSLHCSNTFRSSRPTQPYSNPMGDELSEGRASSSRTSPVSKKKTPSTEPVTEVIGALEHRKPLLFDRHDSEDENNLVGKQLETVEVAPKPLSKIVRVKSAPAYLGISKSHYFNLRNRKSPYYQKDFAALVEISANCKGHYQSDLDAWLDSKKIKGDGHVSK